jgi:hypothetical protein
MLQETLGTAKARESLAICGTCSLYLQLHITAIEACEELTTHNSTTLGNRHIDNTPCNLKGEGDSIVGGR